ncbi:membrane protein [Bacillus phage W.Ph.]|uniref:Gp8 n=1 Tax=Bacillus phage W.Ph. TaxID=764595 RepID=G9B1A9_9CAUD|nr:membrane protein [Bacillus phage W.Ph.]ADH03154.1 gp8 [Bacillus phage W.Ph.]
MLYAVLAIVFTIIFYSVASYMSFVTASILHRGVVFRLLIPTVKALSFIVIVYTSIIADIILFNAQKYESVAFKNGVMSTVIVSSITTSRDKGGVKHD